MNNPANPLISVIIPIYNVESYLPRCLESVLSQTLPNLEIILVDDVSPDRCGAICDEYAAKDPRIRVLRRQECRNPARHGRPRPLFHLHRQRRLG